MQYLYIACCYGGKLLIKVRDNVKECFEWILILTQPEVICEASLEVSNCGEASEFCVEVKLSTSVEVEEEVVTDAGLYLVKLSEELPYARALVTG